LLLFPLTAASIAFSIALARLCSGVRCSSFSGSGVGRLDERAFDFFSPPAAAPGRRLLPSMMVPSAALTSSPSSVRLFLGLLPSLGLFVVSPSARFRFVALSDLATSSSMSTGRCSMVAFVGSYSSRSMSPTSDRMSESRSDMSSAALPAAWTSSSGSADAWRESLSSMSDIVSLSCWLRGRGPDETVVREVSPVFGSCNGKVDLGV
jgi:hypothetical protein